MPALRDRVEPYCLYALALCCMLAASLLGAYLASGHNWGDDFGAYLHLARNLQLGRPYDYLTPDMGEMTPPGFPWLLSRWAQLTGWELVKLKTLNVFSWVALAAATYRLARYHVPSLTSLLTALAVLCCPFFVYAQQDLISDMPYAVVSTVCLCLATAAAQSLGVRRLGWTLALAAGVFVAFSFRPATIGLVAALVGYQLYLLVFGYVRTRKVDFTALATAGLIVATTVVFVLLVPGPFRMHGTNAAGHTFSLALRSSEEFKNFSSLFLGFNAPVWAAPLLLSSVVIGALMGALRQRSLAPVHFLAMAYLSMIVLTPWDGGPRYLFPLVPVAFVFIAMAAQGWQPAPAGTALVFGRAAAFVVLLGLVVNGGREIHAARAYSSDEIQHPKAVELVQWLRDNTRADEALCAFKPRAILYLVERRSMHIGFEPYGGDGDAYLRAMQCGYAVVPNRGSLGGLYDGVSAKLASDPTLQKVYDNTTYSVFIPKAPDARH